MSDPLVIKDITGVDNKTILECYKKEFTEESIEKILDALRPHGKWIVAEDCEFVMKCSNCNEDAEYLDGGSKFLSKYCPNCGAKMEGGEEE